MKHTLFGKGALTALLVTTLVWAFIGCDALSQDKLILESITITRQPAKTTYTIGESLDLSGLVVTGTYSDGITQVESVSASNISGYDSGTTGRQTLIVTVNGRTAFFNVTVNVTASAGTLQSIAVTSQPAKTTYIIGESLDLNGLVVTGTYVDGATKTETVSEADVSGYDSGTTGRQTLMVTVNGRITFFNVTVNVTASAGTLQSIAVTSQPAKTIYTIGESLDLSGLVVTGTYSDRITQMESVSASGVSGYDSATTGRQTLIVTVNGKTAFFNVTVNAVSVAALQSIAITSQLTKTTYTIGESLDLSGLVVTGTYSDNTTQTETVSASNVSGYDSATIGRQTLMVTVNGRITFFNVTVNATASAGTLQSIAVTSQPSKTIYTIGESLDLSGLVVTGTYSDGITEMESVSASDISGYAADTTGRQTLIVTVNGKTAFFNVTVNAVSAAALRSITITSQPAKTTYAIGESLDLSGLVVTGTYSDGTTQTESVSASDISGYAADTTGRQTLIVTVNGKTAFFNITVNVTASAGTLQSIAVTSQPAKTTYIIGESLDLSGLVVTGTYSDGTTKTESVSASNISGYDSDTTGRQTLIITVNGRTAFFNVTVNVTASAGTLQSIAVTSQPAKTIYTIGESLDLSGLVVTGTYSDGITQTESVSASDISGYDSGTTGRQTLIITVNGKTAFFNVTVNTVSATALRSIAITSQPAKTTYTIGESLDLSGLVVTGTYSDNTTKMESVSASDISGYDPDTTGRQTLIITVNGKTAFFNVTVNPAALRSIAITSQPAKATYIIGESLDLTGLVVIGTYSNNSTKAESVSLFNISGYNANTTGWQTLTVSVDGKTATFTVNVQAIAALTVNFEDPINGIPENIVLSKSGNPSSVVLAIVGAYAGYTWRLNDKEVPVSTTVGYTLNAADCPLGKNFLTVELRTSAGRYYSKEITFIVIK
jgi:hypothetical protein